MPNIFDEYFKNDDDEEKTPSQQAAEQVKSEANIFDEYFTQETQVKQQPVQEKPPVEEKKPFISKAVEAVKGFFFGDKETAPVPDERIQESALTVNQQARGSLESTKQEVISYLKDSVSQSSKYREFVSSLDVDNFDDNKRKIQRIVSLPGEFEVTGVQEVGKGIFKHDIETSKYESRKGTDLFNKIKTIEDTIQHTDEATGAISANRGLFKQLYEGIKDFDYVFPSSYTNYQESLDKKHLEAYEKVKNNEEITDDDLVYLNSIRANVFNELTEKGYGTLAADVITGSLSFGAEMTLMKSLAPSVSLGASPALNAIKSDKVRAVVEKIVGNSVQLAVNSQFDIPTMPNICYLPWIMKNGYPIQRKKIYWRH